MNTPKIVLPIFYWEDDGLMTAAVRYKDMNFGLSFPINKNMVRKNMDKKKLLNHLKEVSSVLTFYGEKVLDGYRQLDMRKINEQEAIRWKFDPLWDKRIKAFNKLVQVKEITKGQAIELNLL